MMVMGECDGEDDSVMVMGECHGEDNSGRA